MLKPKLKPVKLKVNKTSLDEVIKFLLTEEVTGNNKIKLTSALLKNLNAFPLTEVFTPTKTGAILVSGRRLSLEETNNFLTGIASLKSNFAFQVLSDQIMFKAIQQGIHQGFTPEQIMFSKTALWYFQCMKEYLDGFK